ncbi:hypothetical protein IMZ48_37690 [Candidatus Bathyarchaeota archaeon]|nr:hypothetical protein [Candidatus Bathyarchaeota archaeon]
MHAGYYRGDEGVPDASEVEWGWSRSRVEESRDQISAPELLEACGFGLCKAGGEEGATWRLGVGL